MLHIICIQWYIVLFFQVIFAILKHIVACPNLKVEENTGIMDFIS
jgi:hypothetical protein